MIAFQVVMVAILIGSAGFFFSLVPYQAFWAWHTSHVEGPHRHLGVDGDRYGGEQHTHTQ